MATAVRQRPHSVLRRAGGCSPPSFLPQLPPQLPAQGCSNKRVEEMTSTSVGVNTQVGNRYSKDESDTSWHIFEVILIQFIESVQEAMVPHTSLPPSCTRHTLVHLTPMFCEALASGTLQSPALEHARTPTSKRTDKLYYIF